MQETNEMRELTAYEIGLVDGGLRFAARCEEGVLSLGVEIGDTRYIVNIGSFGVNAFSKPAD